MKFCKNEEFQRDSEDMAFITNNNINRKFEIEGKEENYNKKIADKVTCNLDFGSPHHISLYNPLNSDKYASIVNKKYRCGKINKKEPLTINEKVRRIFIIRFVTKKAKLLNLKFVKHSRN